MKVRSLKTERNSDMSSVKTTHESSASQIKSAGKDPSNITAQLTQRWKVAEEIGVNNIFERAAIIADAKKALGEVAYESFLKPVCFMASGTADKWVMIHNDPNLRKHKSELTHDWTFAYQLARFHNQSMKKNAKIKLTAAKAYTLFLKALTFIKAEAPTYEELRAKVNELLEKPESEKLYRSDKLVHNDKGFKEAADRIQAKAKEAVQAKKKAEAEAAHAKKEAAKMEKAIKKLETIVAKKKDSGHEPTPAAIKAHQEFDWDDGENRVRVETFNAKYKALLAKKEVQKKLAKVMHDCGLVNHEAVIRECQPMARKAAA
ncbi:MAG TPA: hypothetical protein VKX39_14785 [Bryobacteraceae bacterium]|nr:hypothetical protein [Bryobacteraceae bacterium]